MTREPLSAPSSVPSNDNSDDQAARDVDWTTRQQGLASDPIRSAWVSANAGSGKTHVLSQRVIRLLLAGSRPSAILCLTYTKAAASEMANRVFDRLSEWTRLDDAELSRRIYQLEGKRPDAIQLGFARQLFAHALETPGGLKIQTIHAFCEAILHQFPLEANVAGHFDVMDDAATAQLLAQARQNLLSTIASGQNKDLKTAFDAVLDAAGEWGLEELLAEIVRKRQAIRQFLIAAQPLGGVDFVLRKALGLGPQEDEAELMGSIWPLPSMQAADLLAYKAAAQAQSAATPKKLALGLTEIDTERDAKRRFDLLLTLFLTKDGKRRSLKNAASAKVLDAFPQAGEKLEAASVHVHAMLDRLHMLRMIRCTIAALELARHFDHDYEQLKQRQGALDFDDLVARTANLLQRDGAGPWVHYKLDQGIDHILVDEAQDTSPGQWAVIAKLAEEFFAGKTSGGDKRTLFAVGDEKQSIYSFQGARPELFMQMGRSVQKQAFSAEKHFDALNLYLSFRSTSDILSAVDTVFADEQNRRGLGATDDAVAHASFRAREPGCVDVWEMIGKEAGEDHQDWKAPFDATPESAPPAQLARRVAGTIKQWLHTGETRVEKGKRKPISAGDILVLVRKRDGFVSALMRELKRNHIPVAGADRLKLVEHIAIEDLMALGRFMTMPQDDLSLCAVLKSPLFGVSESDLYRLAGERGEGESVFDALRRLAASEAGQWLDASKYLTDLRAWVDRTPVYDFYARVLGRDGGRAKFLARLGSEASDILDEFLNFALEHEQADLPGLQSFLTTLEARSPEIKRELEQGRDEIRIMTVHASKGLEAPIVFLVDSGGKSAEAAHIPKLRELSLESSAALLPPAVIWVPGKSYASLATDGLKARIMEASEEEYRRLLYVGMTRAADRLVICGYHGLIKPAYQHWHMMISAALGDHAATSERTYETAGQSWQGLHYTIAKAHQSFEPQATVADTKKHPALPDSFNRPFASSKRLPRPLTPSGTGIVINPEAGVTSNRSALFEQKQSTNHSMERGRIIHRLLQLLPSIDPAGRQPAAERYLARAAKHWTGADCDSVIASVMAILDDADFAACFAPGSRAEVSMMGTLVVAGEERALSARVDRIAVTANRVLIIDYKANRPPPVTLDQVAPDYIKQLALYRALLQPLYPDREIEAALLFTEAPRLIALESTLLEKALEQIGQD